MDEIQMVRGVYPEPAPPTADEIARARALLSESPRRPRHRHRPRRGLGRGGALVACGAAAAAAAGIVVAVPHSPGGPPAAGPAASHPPAGTPSATRAATGPPPTVQELAYRASAAALAAPAVAPGQWVYTKEIQRLSIATPPKGPHPGGTKYDQYTWKDGYETTTSESWQTADGLKITEIDYADDSLKVESNPTLGKDISYAELVGFKGDPRALASYVFHRETQILGPEPAAQTWFETYYELAGLFGWFDLPPRVTAEILRALPYVPGVRVEKVAGGIAFSDAGVEPTSAHEGEAVRIVLDPASYTVTSVNISSGKFSNQFNLVNRVPVSGPGVRP